MGPVLSMGWEAIMAVDNGGEDEWISVVEGKDLMGLIFFEKTGLHDRWFA